MLNIVFSIDTEPSIAGYFKDPEYNPMLDEPVAGIVNDQSEALGFLIRLFNQYDFMATFFIETVHQSHFPIDAMGKYVDQLLKANQDIQLHIHPVWQSFKGNNNAISDNCSDHSVEFLAELMQQGKELIQKWTGIIPTVLRTGRFSVGRNVYTAMDMADLSISSNICLGCFMPSEPELHVTHGIHQISEVTEIPVTNFYDKNIINRNGLRPLQITSVGAKEMIYVLDQMEKTGHEIAMIVTHPFEFIKYDDYRFKNMRINKLIQKRAEKLCEYLAKNSDRFRVIPITKVAELVNPKALKTPVGHSGLAFLRTVENGINDNIF